MPVAENDPEVQSIVLKQGKPSGNAKNADRRDGSMQLLLGVLFDKLDRSSSTPEHFEMEHAPSQLQAS